jgi:glycosyltransferase involved in cell wall biosynthesis
LKIAICEHLTASYWGGGEKEMHELATGLSLLGHEVEVYAVPYTLENKRKVDRSLIYNDGIDYHERLVGPIKADVAYMMYHPFAWANFITRAPKVASFHSLIWFTEDRSGYGPLSRAAAFLSDRLIGRELDRYDAVHVHYPTIARELRRRAPGHPRLYTIEHFIDTDVFKPNGPKASDKFRVGFVGRGVWQKGFDLFLRLAHETAEDDIEFFYVGGDLEDKKVKSMGLLRDAESMASFYGSVHMIVSPERVRTVGRSVLESLSCGTPVAIMTKSIDMPLSGCESLLTSDSYEGLKELVMDAYHEWAGGGYDEVKLGAAARGCVVANFSHSPTILKYDCMLREVAAGIQRVETGPSWPSPRV